MRRALRENTLSIVFLALFALALAGQAFTGWHAFNDTAAEHGEEAISFGRYLTSSSFGQAMLENWQSEYLQFTLYILLTVWFIQHGSPESKRAGEEGGRPDDEEMLGEHAPPDAPRAATAGGLRTRLYSNSLVTVMATIWLLSWFGQSVTGWSEYNADQLTHDATPVNWLGYIGTSDFWEATLQNWQSEFLAVGSMAVFSIYLCQRGSPESKPVGAPHSTTGRT